MAAVSKIVDEQEVLRWFEEDRTYQWMTEQYRTKYNVETVPSMWSNFRRRRGIHRRINRDDDLIPWAVLPKHRWRYPLQMLRFEARSRAGMELKPKDLQRLPTWRAWLAENNLVVHYDPDLEEGFVYVPREERDDDIIRRPRLKTGKGSLD